MKTEEKQQHALQRAVNKRQPLHETTENLQWWTQRQSGYRQNRPPSHHQVPCILAHSHCPRSEERNEATTQSRVRQVEKGTRH